jgi:hypothetical protein
MHRAGFVALYALTAVTVALGGCAPMPREIPREREQYSELRKEGFQWDWNAPKLVDRRTIDPMRMACQSDAESECGASPEFWGVYVDGARWFVVFGSTVVSDLVICYEFDTLQRRFVRKFRIPMV